MQIREAILSKTDEFGNCCKQLLTITGHAHPPTPPPSDWQNHPFWLQEASLKPTNCLKAAKINLPTAADVLVLFVLVGGQKQERYRVWWGNSIGVILHPLVSPCHNIIWSSYGEQSKDLIERMFYLLNSCTNLDLDHQPDFRDRRAEGRIAYSRVKMSSSDLWVGLGWGWLRAVDQRPALLYWKVETTSRHTWKTFLLLHQCAPSGIFPIETGATINTS